MTDLDTSFLEAPEQEEEELIEEKLITENIQPPIKLDYKLKTIEERRDLVEKIGATKDGKWTYIRFTKTVDGVETVEWGWCASQFITVEGENSDPITDPNTPPAVEPIL